MNEDFRDRVDLGTWGTFRTGWWVIHILSILIVGYIGYRIGSPDRYKYF